MARIESRPKMDVGRPFDYLTYFEVEAAAGEERRLSAALLNLEVLDIHRTARENEPRKCTNSAELNHTYQILHLFTFPCFQEYATALRVLGTYQKWTPAPVYGTTHPYGG